MASLENDMTTFRLIAKTTDLTQVVTVRAASLADALTIAALLPVGLMGATFVQSAS